MSLDDAGLKTGGSRRHLWPHLTKVGWRSTRIVEAQAQSRVLLVVRQVASDSTSTVEVSIVGVLRLNTVWVLADACNRRSRGARTKARGAPQFSRHCQASPPGTAVTQTELSTALEAAAASHLSDRMWLSRCLEGQIYRPEFNGAKKYLKLCQADQLRLCVREFHSVGRTLD